MIEIAEVVGAIPPIYLFAAGAIVLMMGAVELVPWRRSRAQPTSVTGVSDRAAAFCAEPEKTIISNVDGRDVAGHPAATAPLRDTYADTSCRPQSAGAIVEKSCAHPSQVSGQRNALTLGACPPPDMAVRTIAFVPSPFSIAPRSTKPNPRIQSEPIRSAADMIARDFVSWAIKHGHVDELVREDVRRLAHGHFALETGIAMPRDNHFFAALKKVAGVECLSCRTIYHLRGPYAGSRTTYWIWPEVARRDRLLDRAGTHIPAAERQRAWPRTASQLVIEHVGLRETRDCHPTRPPA